MGGSHGFRLPIRPRGLANVRLAWTAACEAQRSIHRGFPVFAPWRIEFDAVDVRSLFAH